MKKLILLLGLVLLPLVTNAQNYFDSLEENDDVTAIVVNKNMFKLMSKIDIDTDDPEAQEYISLIKNIDDLKVFVSKKPDVSAKMHDMMNQYRKKANLEELMRVKDKDANVKFYFKQGSNEDKVAELLMFVTGINDVNVNGGNVETVLLSLTGDIDLKQISKLTNEMDLPGGKHLKKAEKK
ncbi:DUF4252 domain-containing protein [Pseudofulvibacter geojedonensis]|uniref:DUF4252 domain-containing protein n=1 Tax=Pseudofulvibacter geojedonensis TaxID=1123758 RepID=A0ABW3HZG4_9FLAO